MEARRRVKPVRYCDFTDYGKAAVGRVCVEFGECSVHLFEGGVCVVADFVIEEGRWRRGYGRELVRRVQELYEGCQIFCSCFPDVAGFWGKVSQGAVCFEDLPVQVRSRVDSWGHKKLLHFLI